MFRIKKQKGISQCRCIWIGRSYFMDEMLACLQKGLDASDNDIRLLYNDRCSFPKRFWSIQIEFPDGRMRFTKEDLDLVADDLIKKFQEGGSIKKAVSLLFWFAEDSKNIASEIELSYAITDACGKNGLPGVIVYWER
jgi:hypothetical protein